MEKITTIIGENIQNYMDIFGFTQVDLATKLGISPSAVRSWVKYGSLPRAKQIEQMCELFGCTYDDLVTGKKPKRIVEDLKLNQICEFAKRLTDEGKDKVLAYMNDLSGRYIK